MIVLRVLLVLLLGGCGGLVYWTQTLARTYGYHLALGPAWWQMEYWPGRVYPLYAPWKALVWEWQWGASWAPWLGLVVAGVLLGLGGWYASVRRRLPPPPPLEGHGTTRWANMKDVKKAGLL